MSNIIRRDIMYKTSGSMLICESVYNRLPEHEKKKWVACVPDYDKMERNFLDMIKRSNLIAGEISIPE